MNWADKLYAIETLLSEYFDNKSKIAEIKTARVKYNSANTCKNWVSEEGDCFHRLILNTNLCEVCKIRDDFQKQLLKLTRRNVGIMHSLRAIIKKELK